MGGWGAWWTGGYRVYKPLTLCEPSKKTEFLPGSLRKREVHEAFLSSQLIICETRNLFQMNKLQLRLRQQLKQGYGHKYRSESKNGAVEYRVDEKKN